MNFEEVWRNLEHAAPAAPGLLVRRRVASDSGLDLFLAIEKPAMARSFLWFLPPSVSFSEMMPEPSRGIQITLAVDFQEPRSWLRLALTDHAFDSVFTTLVSDLTAAAQEPPPGITTETAFLQRLERWRQLLARAPGELLGREAQRGLFGELWVMRNLLLELLSPSVAVHSWTGPDGASQDFQLPAAAIEVKTSVKPAPEHLTITGERQLDAIHLSHLFLIHVALDDRQEGGAETLPGIVDDIRTRLISASVPLLDFEDKLHKAGFHDDHRRAYLERSYFIDEQQIFGVGAGFPCITGETLPHGVGNVIYDVALAACLPFLLSEEDLRTAILGAEQ